MFIIGGISQETGDWKVKVTRSIKGEVGKSKVRRKERLQRRKKRKKRKKRDGTEWKVRKRKKKGKNCNSTEKLEGSRRNKDEE